MNVVGKVGSFISQGVYSVATPFHPFGGAVDIIAVQQQDGTFRSTPWYVRFGKFQGVLKGTEKIVRINVNGIEANFHMHLDNSGEAFFLREAISTDLSETDVVIEEPFSCRNGSDKTGAIRDELETCLSDSEIMDQPVEEAGSDGEQRFPEFPDEQPSHYGSVELSEFGSKRHDNLEGIEHLVESQDSDSEVILFSVDGHVLTAPLSSSSDENTENVKLYTPQFHLGPGKGADVCEDSADFATDEDAWASNYISELVVSPRKVTSENMEVTGHHMRISEGEKEYVGPSQEQQVMIGLEADRPNNSENASFIIKEDIFKSCLELSDLVTHSSIYPSNPNSPVGNNLPQDLHVENKSAGVVREKYMGPDTPAASNGNAAWNDGHCDISEGANSFLNGPTPKENFCESWIGEPQPATLSEGIQTDASIGLEISLCGNKLCAGMGPRAAAEAFDSHRISADELKCSAASIIKNEDLIIRYRERYLRWDKAAPIVLGVAAFGLDLPIEAKDSIPIEDDVSGITKSSSGRKWRLWPIPFRRVKTFEHSPSNSSNEELFVDPEPCSQSAQSEPSGREFPRKQLIKEHCPTTEQIASLNLREGQNVITFSFSSRVLGMQQVDAHIYLWMWNTRIVISDVDGTITKSDVLGQFMPLVGRDWSQSGVAQLFSAIKENGYQLLFLSARAIVQAYLTRSFLLNLKQDGKALPNGPVVISPDGLFPSLYREVIRRAPHEFKIACLEDIKALFPADYNPFYAGFGNRDTDELSYRKIGIPKGKIFIINPKGEVAINHRNDVKSYSSLHTLVNDMFPPTALVEQEDYNSWNFWRVPLLDIDL